MAKISKFIFKSYIKLYCGSTTFVIVFLKIVHEFLDIQPFLLKFSLRSNSYVRSLWFLSEFVFELLSEVILSYLNGEISCVLGFQRC